MHDPPHDHETPPQGGCVAGGPHHERVKIADLDDGNAQARVEINATTVADYAADMASGAVFPPVVVYFDGTDYWLADGFHRVRAARAIDRDEIDAEVREGTARDAVLHGVGANASHGLRRTQADKRRAVEILLRDQEWADWSDRKIAKVARVDHKTVGKVRRELLGGEIPSQRTDGNQAQVTAKAGAKAGTGGSVMADLLKDIPDTTLIDEIQRRGFNVEARDAGL